MTAVSLEALADPKVSGIG